MEPGNFWFESGSLDTTVGEFSTEIHLNSGSQQFRNYSINILYNPAILPLYYDKGRNGFEQGSDGAPLLLLNEWNRLADLYYREEINDLGPGTDLNLLSINWKARKAGSIGNVEK